MIQKRLFTGLSLKEKVKVIAETRAHKRTNILVQFRERDGILDEKIFPKIEFGDFNNGEQDTALRHYDEVTYIGYGKAWIPIGQVFSISYDDMYWFSSKECLDAITSWKYEPFTESEILYLRTYFGNKVEFEYGMDDIESLILEVLSDIDN